MTLKPLDENDSRECDVAGQLKPLEEGEELLQEGKPIKILRGPVKPTKLEIEEHEHSHIPFRSWCPHCVRGRGQSSPHLSKPEGSEEEQRVPTVVMDSFFQG